MIAANYHKYADALIRQGELDLSGSNDKASSNAWWTWLMTAGIPQSVKSPVAPSWYKKLKAAAKQLAQKIKTACISLFEIFH